VTNSIPLGCPPPLTGWNCKLRVNAEGAGKSSLLSLVFRLVESSAGETLIDGIKTGLVGLTKLRRSISIIPQDPILMVGTVRYNLDPFNSKTDFELHTALEKVRCPFLGRIRTR
jgi:ABC-type multidrug transport system fused ATPase/permease subunit